ncbi:hypothetical protein BON22_1391 [Cyberlindnera fabianii]|uniref:Uncharacterized protein n=1 Tax=Cyberlindnera fabianii TaxID=36022 RepID=A0A1V2L9X0_CYBFA|nr:hypothetical protein BON22_1391 [Cyberlindnera fabianii]
MSMEATPEEDQERNTSLSDAQIGKLLTDARYQQTQQARNILTRDGVLSMTFIMDQFLEAADKILQFPSQFTVDAFKESLDDPASANSAIGAETDAEISRKEENKKLLLTALNDSYLTLALQLKLGIDLGDYPLFTTLKEFRDSHTIKFEREPVMARFKEQHKYYLPLIPEVHDEELRSRAFNDTEPSPDLCAVGRSKFMTIVHDILNSRFPQQGTTIKKATLYISSKYVAATWARLYELVDPEVDEEFITVGADELFYTYIGAVELSNPTRADKKALRSAIAVLIEPIVGHFSGEEVASDDAMDHLWHAVPSVTYECIYTSTHENKSERLVMVFAYGADGEVLISSGVGTNLLEAEKKAAATALYKKSHLDRCINAIEYIMGGYCEYENSNQHGQEPGGVQSYEIQIQSGTPPVAPPSVYHRASHSPQPHTLAGASMAPSISTTASSSLMSQSYQRQRAEDDSMLEEAAPMADAEIDKTSKQKLNDLLLELRMPAAEYKTSKLSNADVQVVCLINNVPKVRAVSTNKKKAGHMCAQHILNNYRRILGPFGPQR